MQTDSGALNLTPLAWRTFNVTMTGSAVQLTGSPLTITNCQCNTTTGVVTITTSALHQLAVGQYVTISGTDDGRYQGTFPVTAVVDTTHFTYTLPSGITGNTNFSGITTPDGLSGTPQVSYRIWCQAAVFIAPAHSVTVGPTYSGIATAGSSTIPIPIAANAVWSPPVVQGVKFALDTFYATGTNADVLRIAYL